MRLSRLFSPDHEHRQMTITRLSRVFGTRFSLILVCALGLFAVVAILLPLILEAVLERWLVQRGADSAEIADVDLNPFSGDVSVEGLRVRLDDRTVLANSDVDVDLSWQALFQREASIESAVLEGVIVEIEVREDGLVRIKPTGQDDGKGPASRGSRSAPRRARRGANRVFVPPRTIVKPDLFDHPVIPTEVEGSIRWILLQISGHEISRYARNDNSSGPH